MPQPAAELSHRSPSAPLAIHPDHVERVRLRAPTADPQAWDPITVQVMERRNLRMMGRVAVVAIDDVLVDRHGYWFGIPMGELGQLLEQLAGDPGVASILLDIDSPGGTVFGAFELCEKVRALREAKPITAIANAVAASGAYALFAAAAERIVIPSGQVGSVGVVFSHLDWSEADAKIGIKETVILSTPRKQELASGRPLDDEAKAQAQRVVNHYHDMFVASLAKSFGISKGKIANDFGQGRMLLADDAVKRGMAERVATFDAVLAKLTGKAEKQSGRRYSASIERRRLDLREREC